MSISKRSGRLIAGFPCGSSLGLPWLLACALLPWFSPLAMGMDDGSGLEGEFVSADECFRIVVYGHGADTGLLFYGCLTMDSVVYHYVARATNIRRDRTVIRFELPPRNFSRVRTTSAGIAGHQSELPPKRTIDSVTTWRLQISSRSAQLECTLGNAAICGVERSVELRPAR